MINCDDQVMPCGTANRLAEVVRWDEGSRGLRLAPPFHWRVLGVRGRSVERALASCYNANINREGNPVTLSDLTENRRRCGIQNGYFNGETLK